ncbi:MAG TPA: glycosyltransferase [Chloroflexota bacterium]|nr:glycosyltransferase [Chloroflexota bacterium]
MTRRVALISEHASPLGEIGGVDSGGQNVYVKHVARQLASLGCEVDVFTRRDSVEIETLTTGSDGVRVIQVPAGPPVPIPKEQLLPHMPEFTANVLNYARKRPYDLLHANFWMSGLTAAEIKHFLGTPFVITFHALGRVRRLHQGADDGFPEERGDIEMRLIQQADRVIAECPQDRDDMCRYYGADPARIAVVPCGFDPAELWPVDQGVARQELGFTEDEPIVLQLGRMVPRKGVDTVIEAVGFLRCRRGIDARLVIVGGDCDTPNERATPELGRLRQVARSAGVDDLVIFAGRRPRELLKLYYSAADVFVTTPWYEPFGITPLEAMACGAPVIGADVGGIKYSVAHGETGYLVPPRDPEAIGERLVQLLENPQLRRDMGLRAVERVNQLFTWRNVGEELISVYDEVCQTGASAPIHAVSAPPSGAELDSSEQQMIRRGFDDAIAALSASRNTMGRDLVAAADILADCFNRGGKLLVCGNGGSAADAQHLVAELVGRFKKSTRQALPALALTADTAVLTAWANDVGFQDVFARQIEALGQAGDVLIAISTSGRSKNVLAALDMANRRHLEIIAMLGGDGGESRALASTALVVPSEDTQHIQEVHLVLMHLLCELVEERVLACDRQAELDGRIVDLPRPRLARTSVSGRRSGRLQKSVMS